MVKKTKAQTITAKLPKKESSCTISLKDLLEAGCHFGHQSRRWNPKMAPYIWQVRDGVHIFDLAKTAQKLKEACGVAKDLVAKGGTIVFIGTKRQAQAIVIEEAKKASMPYVTNRWLGGTITNWDQIKKSLDKLKEMREKKEKGEYQKYTKRENILIEKEISRLIKSLGGLEDLKAIPEAIFIVDAKREISAVKEANFKGVKTFAILDSNADPESINYLIPANDDAVRSIKLIVSEFAQAVAEGVKLRAKT